MRIAFVLETFPVLFQTFILNQITGLIDRGHMVHIFANATQDDAYLAYMHPDVIRYRLFDSTYYRTLSVRNPRSILKVTRLFLDRFLRSPDMLLRRLNPCEYSRDVLSFNVLYTSWLMSHSGPYDIIHCHFGPNGILGAKLKTLGVPGRLVVTFHGYDISRFINKYGKDVYREVFEKADLLMPISNLWKTRLIELQANPSKVVVHRMGVDLDEFTFEARQDIEGEPVRLLQVSRLVKKKGIENAIRAISIVNERHPECPIRYDVVGEGPLRPKLVSLIEQLELQQSIKLLGAKTHGEVQQLMMQSHICLLPSETTRAGDKEGIPVSLMEAMATGMPVISTLHSGIPELVQDGKTGFLVPERDANALADRIEYLIKHPEIWPGMGRAGRKVVENRYDIDKLNDQLVETYERLLVGDAINASIDLSGWGKFPG